MRASEDARGSGRYVSQCCGEELVLEGETFWRCLDASIFVNENCRSLTAIPVDGHRVPSANFG
jgi:hypothetical protein